MNYHDPKGIGVLRHLIKGINMIKFSIEILYHFLYENCKKWWSIGDFKYLEIKDLTCPFCGIKSKLYCKENENE